MQPATSAWTLHTTDASIPNGSYNFVVAPMRNTLVEKAPRMIQFEFCTVQVGEFGLVLQRKTWE